MKRRWTRAYLLLGGAIAWTIHLLAMSIVSETICVLPGGEVWPLIAITLFCLAVCAGTLIAARRSPPGAETHDLYIYRFGKWAGFLFLIGIFAQTVPLFTLLRGC